MTNERQVGPEGSNGSTDPIVPGSDRLGIGQVGLGGITVAHRAGYRRFGQPIVAGYDPDPTARERLVADTPDATAHDELDALLADPAVDVIDLATPHHQSSRLPVLERIAAAGKPVLIQKPLAMSYDEALELVQVCESVGLTAMVNQNMCFTPSALTLERVLLDQDAIGVPTYAQVQMQYLFDVGGHPWFGKDDRWWTVGLTVHHLGLLQLLFGPPRTVYALIGQDKDQPGVSTDGYGHLALTYPDGKHVLMVSTGTYYGTNSIGHTNEQVWIQGPNGVIDWRPQSELTVSRRASSGSSEIVREVFSPTLQGTWFPDAFGLAMTHFRQALANDRAPLCTAADNLYVMAVIEAAYKSGAEERAVRLDEVMGERYNPTYGPGWWQGFHGWTAPVEAEEPVA